MNPYEIIDNNPVFLKSDLGKQVQEVTKNLTHISISYDDIEQEFFDSMNVLNFDEFIDIVYKEYHEGLLNIYGCFINSNIKEQSLDAYINNIIQRQGLADSQYYYDNETLEKIIRLMTHFDAKEGKANILGYSVDSEKYPNFKISKSIGEYFMVLGFTTIKYLNRGLEIINDRELEDKSTGQALLIEALFMWIKIGNCLRIDINQVMNQVINK